jgi:peptide/nickel transport system permease protein
MEKIYKIKTTNYFLDLFNPVINDKAGKILTVLFCIVCAACFLIPAFLPESLSGTDFLSRNQGVSFKHFFGTDSLGRDNIVQLLNGGRLSLIVGIFGMTLALVIGGFIGLISAAYGGIFDYIFFGMIDLLRAMPGPLLAMTLVITLGQGLVPVVIALGFIYSPMFARISRAVYKKEIGLEYITYSQVNNASKMFILIRHIFPNIIGAFITQCGIVFPRAIVTESVLSFIGMGVSQQTPTWGKIISIESSFFEENPIAVLVPIAALSLVTAILAILSGILRKGYNEKF